MSDTKGPDEVYCASCGETIKKRAKVCPECGGPNERHEGTQDYGNQGNNNLSRTGDAKSATNPSTSINNELLDTTNVSNQWWYGVAASVVLWVVGFGLPETVAGLAFVIAWTLMPTSIYYDVEWVNANTDWSPNKNLWLVVSVVPLVNIGAGLIYTVRRYKLDSPSGYKNRNNQQDTALDNLRERYSQGELTDEEFEDRVEQLVATEDDATAEQYINNKRDN
jgi:uncharacterized membrane protein